MPTFNILIATIGRPSLQNMLNSLAPMLDEEDCLTIVYDGHAEIPNFNLERFKCKVLCYFEKEALGYWGHGIRNKYANLLEPRDFVMHADDDDIYIEGTFNKLRTLCNDSSAIYIGKMLVGNAIIPNPLDLTVYVGNIGTPCGILPFDVNKKGEWIKIYGGDGSFYEQLARLVTPIFLDIIMYKVKP